MPLNDESIKKDIVDELYWDDRVDASKINVGVENGVVTLSGEVPKYGDLAIAKSSAWSISGVMDVIDDLTVKYVEPSTVPSDEEIERRAANMLRWWDTTISITATAGIVSIEGTVDAFWKKAFIEDKISGIHGIVRIENKLAVVPSKDIDDEVISQDVVDAIDRDSMVDAESVTVEVNDGLVNLKGVVPSWPSRRAAHEDAERTAGVVDVNNELKVAV